tara:strand:- start:52 stop:414 length:363 start_codon:yes stop_codon:yes gene_type:complete
MTKPSDYPPVKDMDINAIEALIGRLGLERANKVFKEYEARKQYRIDAIKERGIPEFLEPRETRKSITEIKEIYYPKEYKYFEERERWLTDKDFMILLFEGLFYSGSLPLLICLFAYAILV